MKCLIYVNSRKERAPKILSNLQKLLRGLDLVTVSMNNFKLNKIEIVNFDLGISVGGDGTFVSMVRNFHQNVSRFVGINEGNVGFLTEITNSNLKPSIGRILNGRYHISERSFLKITVMYNGKDRIYYAVNDAYILRSQNKGMVHLRVNVNNEGTSWIRGDGIIISSATGSTAYSLASGGPIMYPSLDAYVITPINSHSLGHKPIVMPGGTFVEIIASEEIPKVSLFLDGHIVIGLSTKHRVRVELASRKYNVIMLERNFFFTNLSQKLHWR